MSGSSGSSRKRWRGAARGSQALLTMIACLSPAVIGRARGLAEQSNGKELIVEGAVASGGRVFGVLPARLLCPGVESWGSVLVEISDHWRVADRRGRNRDGYRSGGWCCGGIFGRRGSCQSLNDRGVHAFGAVVDKELKNVERQPFFDLWPVRRCRNGMAPLSALGHSPSPSPRQNKKSHKVNVVDTRPLPLNCSGK